MFRSTLLGMALAAGLAGSAQAAVVTYFDVDDGVGPNAAFPQSAASAANFVGAAGPLSLLTFEGLAPGAVASFSPAAGVTLSRTGDDYGANLTGVNNTTFGTVFGFNVTAGGATWFGAPEGTMTFTFDSPITAWGAFTTGTQTQFGPEILASFDNGTPQLMSIPPNSGGGVQFIGFISDTPFASITLSKVTGGDAWGIDDVYYTTQATPEPATAALLAAGLLGLAARRRRAR
jgi:hypothetical protein